MRLEVKKYLTDMADAATQISSFCSGRTEGDAFLTTGSAFNPHLNLKLKHLAEPLPEEPAEPSRAVREAIPETLQ